VKSPAEPMVCGLSPGGGSQLRTPSLKNAKFPASRQNTGNFIDSGLGGASEAAKNDFWLVRALSGFTAAPSAESGDKATRFGPFSSQCRAGNVKILRRPWNEDLFRVLEGFPDLAHDDEVDACSGALEMLNPDMKSYGAFEFARQRAEQLLASSSATNRNPPNPHGPRAP
jgi:hypothetical protein